EIRGKPAFSAVTVCLSAACADEACAVSDDPLTASGVEVEPRRRPSSWHLITISRIEWSIVQSRLPSRNMSRCPRSASARSVDIVSLAWGKISQALVKGIGSFSSGWLIPRPPFGSVVGDDRAQHQAAALGFTADDSGDVDAHGSATLRACAAILRSARLMRC